MPPITQTPMTPIGPQLVDYRKRKLELVYGRSRSGKTTWCLALARYLYRKTGKRTRVYLADGGGETIFNTGWVLGDSDDAFIEVVPYTVRDNPIETCNLISMGWKLEDVENPKSRMVAPTREELDTIALWLFDGTTFMGDYMMGEKEGGMANRMAKGEIFNKDDSFRFTDGGLKFGGNSRTHYGYVQRKLLDVIQRSLMLPGLKVWTCHETKADDEERRETIIGPDLVGTKLTPRIGGAFGNTIHMMAVTTAMEVTDPTTQKKVKRTKEEFRAYLQNHYDPTAQVPTQYYANVRVDARIRNKYPELVPEYLFPASPLDLYALLDKAKKLEADLEEPLEKLPDLEIAASVNAPSTDRRITL